MSESIFIVRRPQYRPQWNIALTANNVEQSPGFFKGLKLCLNNAGRKAQYFFSRLTCGAIRDPYRKRRYAVAVQPAAPDKLIVADAAGQTEGRPLPTGRRDMRIGDAVLKAASECAKKKYEFVQEFRWKSKSNEYDEVDGPEEPDTWREESLSMPEFSGFSVILTAKDKVTAELENALKKYEVDCIAQAGVFATPDEQLLLFKTHFGSPFTFIGEEQSHTDIFRRAESQVAESLIAACAGTRIGTACNESSREEIRNIFLDNLRHERNIVLCDSPKVGKDVLRWQENPAKVLNTFDTDFTRALADPAVGATDNYMNERLLDFSVSADWDAISYTDEEFTCSAVPADPGVAPHFLLAKAAVRTSRVIKRVTGLETAVRKAAAAAGVEADAILAPAIGLLEKKYRNAPLLSRLHMHLRWHPQSRQALPEHDKTESPEWLPADNRSDVLQERFVGDYLPAFMAALKKSGVVKGWNGNSDKSNIAIMAQAERTADAAMRGAYHQFLPGAGWIVKPGGFLSDLPRKADADAAVNQ